MSKNPIIVFEGIEGSGKSLHINNVSNYLKKINRKFIRIREPGGSNNSEKIRKLILDNKSSFNENTDLLLYMSARSENISVIKKNFKKKMYFENLTFVPMEKDLINFKMLNNNEKNYLFKYHLNIYSKYSKFLNRPERKWLASLI
ncbi:M24 family metallopeptidase C-terminal domain-containing protein [Candidatus Pelagibacter bacterium]|nr:M24 family metallopeptidase C-terminal domain-containing protein [Candidatus Pelagibacter bacterium]